ncbi:malignant fibrous histiocytoma-amplified sequence 1 [Lingula anatina]|uniref:Malignant fibrous histiocytoma-amplified sequence 1 n=1 Tax=Lingula anatina TaxID=7574 RepID=A0A1S3J0R0_LINAN|nr:malignant fibrous histiocytoma-amplified sequence 1 [Lingula anatina]|eukprot:XP_013404030.1 malignant fibrous histiocytoma-amplified sequence 1 [Lingula anatina]
MAGKEKRGGREVFQILHKLEEESSANEHSALPDLVFQCTELDLEWSHIQHIPTTIHKCVHVKKINASNNGLTALPDSISLLVNLTHLILSWNKFTTFPTEVCGIPNLEHLDLWYNKLASLPPNIVGMTALKRLLLGKNNFTEFPDLVFALPCLEELQLSHNKMANVPRDIGRMTKLRKLWIDNNHLTQLPYQLVNLSKLEDLRVSGNRFTSLPKSVSKRGKEAIFNYLAGIKDSKAVNACTVQLNLLGETEGGKSSLARTLRRGISVLTEAADRTRVVEQREWEPEEDISFNVNDFGGHDVYKVGHPIFISKNGLVLVIFDLSRYDSNDTDHFDKFIGSWMDKVHAQHPSCRVAIVGTHSDQTTPYKAQTICISVEKELQRRIVHKRFTMNKHYDMVSNKIAALEASVDVGIVQAYKNKLTTLVKFRKEEPEIHDKVFVVSSKTMSGYQDLEEFLIRNARGKGVVLPRSWIKAAKNIRTHKYENTGNTLQWEEIKKDVFGHAPFLWKVSSAISKKKSKSNEEIINGVLSFLAGRGDIVWFETSPLLRRIIFHKQEVLSNLLKAVLNHDMEALLPSLLHDLSVTTCQPSLDRVRDDFTKRGVLTMGALECLWRPFGLSRAETDAMFELLQALELCYKVVQPEAHETFFHFPCLLTDERHSFVTEQWPEWPPLDTKQVTLKVYFPHVCPNGLYEKLSVRQHKYLGFYKARRVDWKDGVYAEMESCRMQLTRCKVDGDWVIAAAVRGRHLPELWQTLLRTHGDLMDILEEDWPGMPYDKYLVCPHCVDQGEQYPTLYPGELNDEPLVQPVSVVLCEKTNAMIPANLVYPSQSFAEMPRQQRRAIQETIGQLVHSITTPCLGHMLDTFIQEGIITDREAEFVRTAPSSGDAEWTTGVSTSSAVSPEKTRVLLNLILTKEERAFYMLCTCLEENGQQYLGCCLRCKVDECTTL